MKANSREKLPQNRLNRTQQPPPRQEVLEQSHQVGKKPSIHSENTLPPRVGSSQKSNFKIEENMNANSIQTAKQGLQLLKKKMVRTGMSREKNDRPTSAERRIEEPVRSKIPPKQQEYYGYENEVKKSTPQIPQRKTRDEPNRMPPTNNDRPIKRQPPKQPLEEYVNPNEEKPLNSNQDFMALLEKEMAKEKSTGQQAPKKQAYSKPVSYDDEEQIETVACSKGCGRKFNVNTIEKHEKVCEKVFQSKRKAFNSAAHRQPEVEDFKAPPPLPTTVKQVKSKKPKGKEEKIPKWKAQSAAFRAGIKAGRGQELTKEEKVAQEQASGMVQCPVCSRKFNEEAGKRHIAFCESKAKQMPKMNTKKR